MKEILLFSAESRDFALGFSLKDTSMKDSVTDYKMKMSNILTSKHQYA